MQLLNSKIEKHRDCPEHRGGVGARRERLKREGRYIYITVTDLH